jgi:hypothetical protein
VGLRDLTKVGRNIEGGGNFWEKISPPNPPIKTSASATGSTVRADADLGDSPLSPKPSLVARRAGREEGVQFQRPTLQFALRYARNHKIVRLT